jgi:hypothetical protein
MKRRKVSDKQSSLILNRRKISLAAANALGARMAAL